jgi:heavy metal translocating P-type ATPase
MSFNKNDKTTELESISWIRLGIGTVISGQLMVFNLGYNIASDQSQAPPYGSSAYFVINLIFGLTSLSVIGLLGSTLFRNGLDALKHYRLNVESLFALSLFGGLAGSIINSIWQSGPVYYEVPAIVCVLYALGYKLRIRSRDKVLEAIQAHKTVFDFVWIAGQGSNRHRLPVAQLSSAPDLRVSVWPGEAFAVEGTIEKGRGYIQETHLNGEPLPKVFAPGDHVRSGMISIDGTFIIRPDLTQNRYVDTLYQTLDRAWQSPSLFGQQADRMAAFFVPIVSAMSLLTFIIWLGLMEVSWPEAFYHSMAVIIVACPCAFGLATPLALWTGIYQLSKHGIIVRQAQLIDGLAQCDSVVFDKTGTLSHPDLQVIRWVHLGNSEQPESWILESVAALESTSAHPLAQALTRFLNISSDCMIDTPSLKPGKGIEGYRENQRICVGEIDLMPESERIPIHTMDHGKTLFVSVNNRIVGFFEIAEMLRSSTEPLLKQLKSHAIRCTIVSGDPRPRWHEIGNTPIIAGCTPEAKAAHLHALQAEGLSPLYIGDGLNDLAAMASGVSSLAVDNAAALTHSSADGILIQDRMDSLPNAILFCRNLHARLKENFTFALLYNSLGMLLAASGLISPIGAAVLMLGSSLFVCFRALTIPTSN